jgi:hypothetical protein
LLLALAGLWGCGSDTFKPAAGWGGDLAGARKQAQEEGRPLAILYTAPWSGKSEDFVDDVLRDPSVAKQLERFVLVNVNLEEYRKAGVKNEHGIEQVPALVLERPLTAAERLGRDAYLKEVKKFDQGDYPAEYLVDEMKKLKPWRDMEEDGWLSDPKAAEEQAKKSKKPVAVLYSGAWNEDAVKYEDEENGALRDKAFCELLKSKYTLLRLNYFADVRRAERDGVEKETDLPALVLPSEGEKKLVIPGMHPAKLLTSFVEGLPKYRRDLPGWSSKYEDVQDVRTKRTGGPIAVVLDRPADWKSHHFLHAVLEDGEVAERLKDYLKVRLKYDPKLPLLQELKVKPREVPCVLIFNRFGEYNGKRTHKDNKTSITNLLRQVGGRVESGESAKGG